MSNKYLEQYKKAEEYFRLQNDWYKNHEDSSRIELYKNVGNRVFGKKLLDIGCGFGKDLNFFQKKGADVYGIETSKSMIEIAKREYPSLTKLTLQDFSYTNFKDNYFDIIISRYSIHYSLDLEKSFQELHRILKPGGSLIILAAHPLLTFFAKENYFYGDGSNAQIPIYGGTMSVSEPSHTFSEYFNPFVLQNFTIKNFYESPGLENTETEAKTERIVPDFFLIKLKKRI